MLFCRWFTLLRLLEGTSHPKPAPGTAPPQASHACFSFLLRVIDSHLHVLPLLAWPTHHLLYSEMSRQHTIVSAPFTSRSTTKSPTESIAVFLFTPHNSQALAHTHASDSLAEPSSSRWWQTTHCYHRSSNHIGCLLTDSSSYSPSDSEIEQTEESPSLLSHIRQNVVGLASPNQSPRDPFAVLCHCQSIIPSDSMLEQSLQLHARLLF